MQKKGPVYMDYLDLQEKAKMRRATGLGDNIGSEDWAIAKKKQNA